ncbi:hypothetical protein TWF192_006934 [Orbilia oligospora]|nr:hypothetical protein TWF192_006934 [Orbilia oligospora]
MDDPLILRSRANNNVRRRRYRLASIPSPLSPIREVLHEPCSSPRVRKPIERQQRRCKRDFHKRHIITRKKTGEQSAGVLPSPLLLTAEESLHLTALSMDVEMTGGESLGGLGFNSLTKSFIPSPGHLHPRHHKNDSLSSTSAASSTNSSPTTTVSTVESSSSNDDKSPASSPDSPRNIIPLGIFPKPGLSALNITSSTMASSPNHPYRSLSPIKKARNTKNLSLNMSGSSGRPGTASSFQSNASLNDNNRSSSAPSSPGFILPSTMPRRRPSNLGLTIKLPGPEKSIQKSSRPSLRHHVSSPSLFTPGGQGKTLSGRPSRLFTPPNHFSPVETVSSQSFSTQIPSSPIEAPGPIIEMDEEDIAMMENDGEGPKSPAYPNGPACIYEPNIYLFSEPNADMARNFDVVFNVAREVVNPMKKEREEEEKKKILSPPLETACSTDSFMTAFESPQGSQSTNPNPTPQDKKDPEYIHMPWDHNTPIVGDLPRLVEMIKQKSAEGKKILVHCQCGVSRSASLIIAYGLYMNPRQTVQEAYDFVKQRSKWIGPNMSLIYQLSDWKAKLAAQNSVGRAGKSSVRGGANGMARPKLGHPSRAANSSDPTPYTPEIEEPMTAPLPYIPGQVAPPRPPSPDPRDFPMPMNIQTRNADGGIITGIEPGPMSAPPGMINIPGTASATNHGVGWGSGDARTGYAPPPPPPVTTFPSEPEGDAVGALVGFPARRGSDQGDLPPPTPSFAPKGGMIFEKRQLRNRNRKLLQSLRAEENSMPPPSPVTATNPGLLGHHPSNSPPQRSHSPQPTIKAILPKTTGLAALRAKKNKAELSRAMSDQSGVRRADSGAARPNPEFHRRFPSIMSSIDEPPPTPSFTQPPSSFGFPVRMPTITGKSHSDSHILTRKSEATGGAISASFSGPANSSSNEIASPIDQPMSGTDNMDGIDIFSDPRSPVNQHDTLPTIRNIYDVL